MLSKLTLNYLLLIRIKEKPYCNTLYLDVNNFSVTSSALQLTAKLGIGNSQIRFTETCNVFRHLKGFTTV